MGIMTYRWSLEGIINYIQMKATVFITKLLSQLFPYTYKTGVYFKTSYPSTFLFMECVIQYNVNIFPYKYVNKTTE